MKESIINFLKEHGKSSVNDIAQALNHAGGEKFPQLIKAMSAMESKGQLRFNRDGSVSLLAMLLTVILLLLLSRSQRIVCVGRQQKHGLLKL